MIEILLNLKKEEQRFSDKGWGHGRKLVTKEQLEDIMDGKKAMAIFDGEYTIWIATEEPKYIANEDLILEINNIKFPLKGFNCVDLKTDFKDSANIVINYRNGDEIIIPVSSFIEYDKWKNKLYDITDGKIDEDEFYE